MDHAEIHGQTRTRFIELVQGDVVALPTSKLHRPIPVPSSLCTSFCLAATFV